MGLIFHKLIKFDEALEIVKKETGLIKDFEAVPIISSVGRVSAGDNFSSNNLPLFTRSQVDGFAVIAADTEKASYNSPVELIIKGETNIGEPGIKFTGSGTCIRVPTGGVVPVGADAMIPFEDTEESKNIVKVLRPVNKFNEMSNSGIDVIRGEKILGKYLIIEPPQIAVLAATGINRINVLRQLKIGIVSTGNELLEPGSEYIDGKIYESNSISIFSELSKYPSFNVRNYGIVSDDYNKIKNAIEKSLNENDVTLTIGSTSAGDHDVVYKIAGELNPGIIFHGIRVKPGKPALFAKSGDKILFGLPGFPVSSMMILYSLVLPSLFNMLNVEFSEFSVRAVTGERFELHYGNTDLLLIKLVKKDGIYHAFQVRGNSGSISRISKATGYSIINSEMDYMPEGTDINVKMLSQNIPEILLAGQYFPYIENMSFRIVNHGIFVEQGYNEIVKSMNNSLADCFFINYDGIQVPDNYEPAISFNIPFGYVYGKKDFKTIALLYNGSGLAMKTPEMEKNISKIFLDNPEIICDYVKNGRCDSGITYELYAKMYGLNFEKIGDDTFKIYIKKSGKFNINIMSDLQNIKKSV